jgi:hypothetical protein
MLDPQAGVEQARLREAITCEILHQAEVMGVVLATQRPRLPQEDAATANAA